MAPRYSDDRCINATFMLALGYIGAMSTVLRGAPTNGMLSTFYKPHRPIGPFTGNIVALLVLDTLRGLFACLSVVRTIVNEWLGTAQNCQTALFVMWTYSSLLTLLSANLRVDRWLTIVRPVWYRRDRTDRDNLMVLGCIYLYHNLVRSELLTIPEPQPKGEYCDQPSVQLTPAVSNKLLLIAVAIIPQGILYTTEPVLF
ncbi:hypothetical protein RvY_04546 [Ramazzottius varieornatus]|uniref:G-protein coupled receptors family 1 profile domain-containing protein n=1 Tax=Ramazzottius varieornatus TaxID=947166 RepID=A0A1D1UVC0_RAMVA|nr:hypothetical protein RvY_04546 [Ramazzottius varieornatus]